MRAIKTPNVFIEINKSNIKWNEEYKFCLFKAGYDNENTTICNERFYFRLCLQVVIKWGSGLCNEHRECAEFSTGYDNWRFWVSNQRRCLCFLNNSDLRALQKCKLCCCYQNVTVCFIALMLIHAFFIIGANLHIV